MYHEKKIGLHRQQFCYTTTVSPSEQIVPRVCPFQTLPCLADCNCTPRTNRTNAACSDRDQICSEIKKVYRTAQPKDNARLNQQQYLKTLIKEILHVLQSRSSYTFITLYLFCVFFLVAVMTVNKPQLYCTFFFLDQMNQHKRMLQDGAFITVLQCNCRHYLRNDTCEGTPKHDNFEMQGWNNLTAAFQKHWK